MSVTRSGDHRVRAFMVRLPSGAGYWTVLDEDLAVVAAADAFLRQGRVRPGRGAAYVGLFMTWLLPAGRGGSGAGAFRGGAVLRGPGSAPAGSARRVNGIL